MHNLKQRLPALIQLVLKLFGKAEQRYASCQCAHIVTRHQSIRDIGKECRPFFWIVKSANSDHTSLVLLHNRTAPGREHLGDNVSTDVVLVLFVHYDVSKARYRDPLGLLLAVELPLVVDELT